MVANECIVKQQQQQQQQQHRTMSLQQLDATIATTTDNNKMNKIKVGSFVESNSQMKQKQSDDDTTATISSAANTSTATIATTTDNNKMTTQPPPPPTAPQHETEEYGIGTTKSSSATLDSKNNCIRRGYGYGMLRPKSTFISSSSSSSSSSSISDSDSSDISSTTGSSESESYEEMVRKARLEGILPRKRARSVRQANGISHHEARLSPSASTALKPTSSPIGQAPETDAHPRPLSSEQAVPDDGQHHHHNNLPPLPPPPKTEAPSMAPPPVAQVAPVKPQPKIEPKLQTKSSIPPQQPQQPPPPSPSKVDAATMVDTAIGTRDDDIGIGIIKEHAIVSATRAPATTLVAPLNIKQPKTTTTTSSTNNTTTGTINSKSGRTSNSQDGVHKVKSQNRWSENYKNMKLDGIIFIDHAGTIVNFIVIKSPIKEPNDPVFRTKVHLDKSGKPILAPPQTFDQMIQAKRRQQMLLYPIGPTSRTVSPTDLLAAQQDQGTFMMQDTARTVTTSRIYTGRRRPLRRKPAKPSSSSAARNQNPSTNSSSNSRRRPTPASRRATTSSGSSRRPTALGTATSRSRPTTTAAGTSKGGGATSRSQTASATSAAGSTIRSRAKATKRKSNPNAARDAKRRAAMLARQAELSRQTLAPMDQDKGNANDTDKDNNNENVNENENENVKVNEHENENENENEN